MSEFEIKRAVRCGVVPLLGMTGRSGGGKTKSALLIARGIAGPSGKIAGIDTENGRMNHHADDPAIGGYDVLDLQPPFSPEMYADAIKAVIASGYKVCVVDSASHEWNGEGGCLEAQAEWMKGKPDSMKMLSWNHIAKLRAPYLNLILRCPIPLILCFRVKDKVIIPREDAVPAQAGERRQKPKITFEEDAPITRKDLIFEMLWTALVEAQDGRGGFFHLQKTGPDSLWHEFDAVKSPQICVEHGAAIARWCQGTAMPSNAVAKGAKQKLWGLLKHAVGPQLTMAAAENFLKENNISTGDLSQLTEEQMSQAADKVSIILQQRSEASQ